MKVLHVYKTYLPDDFGGIARAIWEIAESTYAHGVESDVLSLSPHPDPERVAIGHHVSHRVRQDLFLASTSLSLSVFRRFRELASAADVVHYHFPWPLMDLLHLASGVSRPAIVTYHSDVIRQQVLRTFYAPLMHAFLGRVDRIVATSPNYRDSSAVLRRHLHKVTVVPLGLADRPPISPSHIEKWRRRFPTPFLLFVGAMRYYKGLPFLIEAARRSGVPVAILGRGDLFSEVEHTHPPNVSLLGELDDVDKDALLWLCRGFVFPSHLRSEAFGLALLEAARAGRPMISCEIGSGTSYINIDGQTGRVVPPADPAALAAAMTQLMEDPGAVEMGQAARRRYEALFTADAMALSYIRLYQQALDARTP